MTGEIAAAFAHWFGLRRDDIARMTLRDYRAHLDFIKRATDG